MDGFGWMHGGWFWGGQLLAIAVVAVLVWVIIRATNRPDEPRHDTAEQILKQRYARGEISKEEYEQKLADLRR